MSMEQEAEGRTLPDVARKKQRIPYKDVVAVAIIAVIIAGFVGLMISKASLKRDIAGAQIVADKVIADVSKKDGAAARKLGNAEFQKLYTDKTLTKQFQAISEATVGTPSIDYQSLSDKDSKKTVYTVYKYPPRLADRSFYIGVVVTQSHDTWKLVNISGSADRSKLFTK